MKISHRKSQALLAEYAAGELDRAEHLALTAHLERCQICRQDLAEIQHIRALMRSLAAQPFPDASSAATLTDLESIFAAPAPALAMSSTGRQYRSIPEAAREQRQPRRRLLSLLAAVLLGLVLICSTALVLNLELRGHTGRAVQQYSTPTVIPPGDCNTSTPSQATPTPTEAGMATPTPQAPPLTPTLVPTPTPTSLPRGCPHSVLSSEQ